MAPLAWTADKRRLRRSSLRNLHAFVLDIGDFL
jgi:hypothetical protein